MSKYQHLRAMVNQRLTAAAEDIFLLFEKAMLELEDEVCRSKQNQQSPVPASALSPKILQPRAEPGHIPQEEKASEEQPEEEQLSVSDKESRAGGVKRKASQLRVVLTSKSDGYSEHSDTDDDDEWETASSARSSGLLPKYDIPPDGSPFANNGVLSGAGRAAGGVGRAVGGFGGPGGVAGGFGRAAGGFGGVGVPVGVGRGEAAARGRGSRPQRMQHPCPFCNKNFGTNQILQRHIKYHTGEKPSKVPLDSHLNLDLSAVNSGDLPTPEEFAEAERNNQCPMCYKQFRNKPNLRRHMRIHTGEKPFKCSLCMKTFTQKSHLDAHLKTHKEHAAFNCLICGVAFSTYSCLIEHFKTHSDVEPSTWSQHWLFKRSAAESDEENDGSKDENEAKRQLLDSDLQLGEGVPSPSHGQETPQIKEEPEEQSINIKQEEEQLPVSMGEFVTVCVKEEEAEVSVETQKEVRVETQKEVRVETQKEVRVEIQKEVRRGADSDDHTEDSSDMDEDDYDESERFHNAGPTFIKATGNTARLLGRAPQPRQAPPLGRAPLRQAPLVGRAPGQAPLVGRAPGQAPLVGRAPGQGQAPLVGRAPGQGQAPLVGRAPGQAPLVVRPPLVRAPGQGQAPLLVRTPLLVRAPLLVQAPGQGQASAQGQAPGQGQAPLLVLAPAQGQGQAPLLVQVPAQGQVLPSGQGQAPGQGQALPSSEQAPSEQASQTSGTNTEQLPDTKDWFCPL